MERSDKPGVGWCLSRRTSEFFFPVGIILQTAESLNEF